MVERDKPVDLEEQQQGIRLDEVVEHDDIHLVEQEHGDSELCDHRIWK